jgi:hypothetical protein
MFVAMNNKRIGELGGHVGAVEGAIKDASGKVVGVRVLSTNTEDEGGNLQSTGGMRDRYFSEGDIRIRRGGRASGKRSDAAPVGANLGRGIRLASFDGSTEEGTGETGALGRGYGRNMIPGTNIPDRGWSEDRVLGGRGRPTDRIVIPGTEDLGLGRQKVEPYGGKGVDASSPADDSTHHVEVHFRNAPSGMRSGLTRADGPASVAVRTQYAMDGVV